MNSRRLLLVGAGVANVNGKKEKLASLHAWGFSTGCLALGRGRHSAQKEEKQSIDVAWCGFINYFLLLFVSVCSRMLQ